MRPGVPRSWVPPQSSSRMRKSTMVVSPRRTIGWATSTTRPVSAMCLRVYRSTGTPEPIRRIAASNSVGNARLERLRDLGDADAERPQLRPSAARPRLVDRVGDRRALDVRPPHVAGAHLGGLVVVVEDEVPGKETLAHLALEVAGHLGVRLDPLEPLVEPVLGPGDPLILRVRSGPYPWRLPVPVGRHPVDRRTLPDDRARTGPGLQEALTDEQPDGVPDRDL